jgi:hypothetical protein
MLTTASYLHDMRLLRILAVLAAILAAFFARAIACWVRTLIFILVLSHFELLLDPVLPVSSILELPNFVVKHKQSIKLGTLTHNNSPLSLAQI